MTEHNPYKWYKDLQEGAEKSRKEQAENFNKSLAKLREKAEAKRQSDQELFNKVLQKMHDENEERKENEIARAKAEA
ncbi:hypothetical protein, partial [Streptococcus suis]